VSSFFDTDDTKHEYNANDPVNDVRRCPPHGRYRRLHPRGSDRGAIHDEGLLPDMLSFDSSKPAKYSERPRHPGRCHQNKARLSFEGRHSADRPQGTPTC
jgi:hypothetical protein